MPVIEGACIGIDLGTANCLVCNKDKGIVSREPSVVAYDIASDRVIAIGSEAKRMIGKTPFGITTVKPLKDGVIADFGLTLAMMKILIGRAMRSSLFARPKVIVCIPYGITEVEQRAVENAAVEAGASGVALVEEPVAAAIGAGLPIRQPKGNMIVDIGGGTTEVAVVTGGGVALSKSLRVAGDACDKAIAEYIRKKFNVLIGENTAENIKTEIGSAHESTDIGMLEVRGRNLGTGLPSVFNIYASEVREAMSAPLGAMIDVIRATLESTPPELCADLYDNGIMLAGGGALLAGLPLLIEERTGLAVTLAKHPLDAVADGIVKIMSARNLRGVLTEVKKV
ncbi:MAG: rod shape-determining protein [Eubacteriales bacterium]|jgi:rod shape-determining protein MreB